MKIGIDYEFKAKIHNDVDIEDLIPKMECMDFVKEFNDVIDNGVRQILADELAGYNINNVSVERIRLTFNKVEGI